MKFRFLSLTMALFGLILLLSCMQPPRIDPSEFNRYKFDLQGHRGCRGLMPENSIPAFKKAIELMVNTLEMDVVISRDYKVVVSHEPWMNPEICILPEIKNGEKDPRLAFNLYQMDYEEIKSFDCGSKPIKEYPDQSKLNVAKPLLETVINESEAYSRQMLLPPLYYNIEIKYKEEGEESHHPSREVFLDLFYEVVENSQISERVSLQCFDATLLNIAAVKYPELKLVYLVDNFKSAKRNLKNLDFTPFAYSPNYKKMSTRDVDYVKSLGIKVIPWTVNSERAIRRVILTGVDGIISDFPDRVNKVIASFTN